MFPKSALPPHASHDVRRRCRYLSILRTSLRVVLLAGTCLGCDPADHWGTPQYFERLTGVAFAPAAPPTRCTQTSGLEVAAFIQVRLPQEAVDRFRERPEALAGFPRQMDYERERKLIPWTRAPLSIEAQTALQLALSGAVAAIDESGCGAVPSAQARESVLPIVSRPSTFYSYQFKPTASEVVPEALEFRVLDLDEGTLYELVSFS